MKLTGQSFTGASGMPQKKCFRINKLRERERLNCGYEREITQKKANKVVRSASPVVQPGACAQTQRRLTMLGRGKSKFAFTSTPQTSPTPDQRHEPYFSSTWKATYLSFPSLSSPSKLPSLPSLLSLRTSWPCCFSLLKNSPDPPPVLRILALLSIQALPSACTGKRYHSPTASRANARRFAHFGPLPISSYI